MAARLKVGNPPPTRPIPVLIGGGGERKTLKHVAKFASIWHAFGDLATMRHKTSVLAEHCATIGRDPAEIEHSTARSGTDTAAADALVGAGFSLFTISVSGPDYDLSDGPGLGGLARRDGTATRRLNEFTQSVRANLHQSLPTVTLLRGIPRVSGVTESSHHRSVSKPMRMAPGAHITAV